MACLSAAPHASQRNEAREDADVRALTAMSAEVFGDPVAEAVAVANALLRRLSFDDGMQLWVAEADGQVVSAGRLEPVPGTEFAGIWGGARRQQWRGRGIYRPAPIGCDLMSHCPQAEPPRGRG
jgi:hypothetical protein